MLALESENKQVNMKTEINNLKVWTAEMFWKKNPDKSEMHTGLQRN
jgi:hypothetical protein